MTEFVNSSYNRGSKPRHMINGLVVNLLSVTIPSNAVVGDTIVVDTMPWDHLYRQVAVRSGGTSGLTVDVGARVYHGGDENPTFFGAAVATATAGSVELLNTPVEYKGNGAEKERHQLYLTLGGTVTPGETIWLDTSALLFGNPEAQ